jgi:XisI protein
MNYRDSKSTDTDLELLGVPQNQIVFAFRSPVMRKYSEYTVA